MRRVHRSFNDVKADIFAPPPVRRARGGRTEMRVAGNPDVLKEADGEEAYAEGDLKAPGTRGKRRAARAKPKTLGSMDGVAPKHRADHPSRRKQKFADGGAPYAASATPYGAGYVPAVQIAPGHFTPPAVPNQPDFTSQLMSAGISSFGRNLGTNNENNSNPVDLGYAIYSNGTPIGIKGIAPFAGGPQDISVGSKRGGRIERRNGRKR